MTLKYIQNANLYLTRFVHNLQEKKIIKSITPNRCFAYTFYLHEDFIQELQNPSLGSGDKS